MSRLEKTMDGNAAAAYVSYAFTQVAAIYPITPSSPMAELVDEWAAEGKENLFGQPVRVAEMESEAGAAAAVHGALQAGALSSTYTASQGLLLMIPNLYKMAGELLPAVFHVAARTIATHALSIFGDHSDIYACRQTGAAMLASGGVQEVMDLSPVAHLSAISGRVPFINFFDGFRTSHEVQKIKLWDYGELKEMLDTEALERFHSAALNPEHADMRGSAQNPDIFFQAREAANTYYDVLPGIVEKYMQEINRRLGTRYGLFEYYGDEAAEHIIIAMGSVTKTIEETIDYISRGEYGDGTEEQSGKTEMKHGGAKIGLVKVHLYRPFSVRHFLECIPKTVRRITVLDRTKEPGSAGEPLYLDVLAAVKDSEFNAVPVFSGRYGLSSKDTTPDQILAVYKNQEKRRFTIGILDDVTGLSLKIKEHINPLPQDIISCKFWGLGGDGTIGANKNSIKIIGNHTKLQVQAYFSYDSKKSRGITVSHLRFGKEPIRAAYLVQDADFVACHNESYIWRYDNMVQDIRPGGIFLLNCSWQPEELDTHLPGQIKRYLAGNHIHFYIIDALAIGKEIGLNSRVNTILQSAFFKIMAEEYELMEYDEAAGHMKDSARVSYEKKGSHIVEMNYQAICRGGSEVRRVEVPKEWENCKDDALGSKQIPDRSEVMEYVENIQNIMNAQKGDELPVSAFLPYVDGTMPSGSSAHERRDVAVDLPRWIPENCIQCNRCSFVCPHAVIRPAVLDKKERENAPASMISKPMTGMEGYDFSIVISAVDCTGCGSCASVCPGMKGNKALKMAPVQEYDKAPVQEAFDYSKGILPKKEVLEKFRPETVKGSQFKKPLMEFSGACAGCGETPYAKLVTQLFGERMYIANATGCTSIWGNSSPSTAYTAYPDGRGPAWANSLFEDAAQFGYGMLMAVQANREKNEKAEKAPSVWIFGGDGWAYDIGFGGLDHVLASGQNINILVFDTQVYSNTGGQASKATPKGASAKFAPGGKKTQRKDLGAMAMTYGNVYVAQVAMGADYNQTVKAFTEAESYDGPSLIIAYCTCIAHGIRSGMGNSPAEEEKAVNAGCWKLFRYNPSLAAEGKEAYILDSKEPDISREEFMKGEIRYDECRKRV